MKSSSEQLVFSNLVELLRTRAKTQPEDKIFIFLRDGPFHEESLTYEALEKRAKAIAHLILKFSAPGGRVLINHNPGLDYICSFFGCLYAGVVAVPVYPPRFNQKMDRLDAIIADVSPSAALTSSTILDTLSPHFNSLPSLKNFPWLKTDDATMEDSKLWKDPQVSSDSLAFIQYTSGSTSLPKGVMLSHRNLIENLKGINHHFKPTKNSSKVSWLPPYHDMGLIGAIISPVFSQVTCVFLSPFTFLLRPFRWLQAISKYRADFSGAPNFAYDLCTRRITDKQLSELDLSSWKLAYCGAEPIRAEVLEHFAEKFSICGFRKEAFYPCYGLAEASLLVSGNTKNRAFSSFTLDKTFLEQRGEVRLVSPEDPNARRLVSCGQVIPLHFIRIVDPKTLKPLPQGKVGEIWFSGPSVAQGYWNKTSKNRSVFRAQCTDPNDPRFYLRTGDLGFLKNNELYVTGRMKDLVIIRGRNYYPQDIEYTVDKSHPLIMAGSGAAVGLDLKDEEHLVIIQEVDRKAKSEDLDEIIEAINSQVFQSHGICPSAISLIRSNSIPLTSSGKIQRHASKQQFIDGKLNELKRFTASEVQDSF